MKYMGSKNRIAKHILPIILKDRKDGQWYVEPFVGGANMIDKVTGNRIGYDVNECLIACLDALANGWVPPKFITREFYSECRDKFNKSSYSMDERCIIGYVGINGSYGGRWFDGGYAGRSVTNSGKVRDYPLEAYNNVMRQIQGLKGVQFLSDDYQYIDYTELPDFSIIYCDPPYQGTKEYITATKSGFNSDDFWQWCRDIAKQGHSVFISEYNAPNDFVCVWEKEVKSSLSANGKIGSNKNSIEKLFIHESQKSEVVT
jgi:DNA adenine methylase